VHALRNVHKALVPGGTLLDMHPIPPSTRVEREGVSLGVFDDSEFMELVAATEAGLEEAGVFTLETQLEFDWLERYESGDELLADVEEWEGCRVPPAVAERIQAAEPPLDIWEHVVLRRFRAIRSPG
jgi:hypothetical protein